MSARQIWYDWLKLQKLNCRVLELAYAGEKRHQEEIAAVNQVIYDCLDPDGAENSLYGITIQRGLYDAIFFSSGLERHPQPWVLTETLANSMLSNGMLYVETHFVFPEQSGDCFRFTKRGLNCLFSRDIEFELIVNQYLWPAEIKPDYPQPLFGPEHKVHMNLAATYRRM